MWGRTSFKFHDRVLENRGHLPSNSRQKFDYT